MNIKRLKSVLHHLVNLLIWPLRKLVFFVETKSDKQYLATDVPLSSRFSHANWSRHLGEIGNKPGMRVLEVGSRAVTGPSGARNTFCNAEYIGFDYYDGDNVDIVGDAHRLSTYFDDEERFDIIYCCSCFEHFAMPWVVAAQIAKLLKVGGYVFVHTHFSFSSHERPWHFFHFTDLALRALFCDALGIECLEAGMSNPIVGRFSSLAEPRLRNLPVRGLYCHSEFFGQKMRDTEPVVWEQLALENVVGASQYPAPSRV